MKKLLVLLALPVLSTLAFAQVDTSKPMVTGKGNVTATLPGRVLVTNQTKTTPAPTAVAPSGPAMTASRWVCSLRWAWPCP
jgi:hypothetical protein